MKDWVEDVRGQCLAGGIPFFFKQWGGFNKKKAGRRLAEKEWSQYPLKALVNSAATAEWVCNEADGT